MSFCLRFARVLLPLLIVFLAQLGQAAQVQPRASANELPIQRGVNIVGYDPIWTDPAKARFQTRHMQAIRDGGFDHVRFNLQAFAQMDADHRLSAQWWRTLDSLVSAALKADLKVIIDQHNFVECAKEVPLCRQRLQAFWQQVAPHFAGAPPAVIFEILNEPNGELDALWNEVLAENLRIIRKSNPKRLVIVGPKFWNSMDQLDSLRLPAADRRLIVTFHYYTPMKFTTKARTGRRSTRSSPASLGAALQTSNAWSGISTR